MSMWLRQIARESDMAKACMDIVGHSGASGSATANDALSLRRAVYVRQRLAAESADAARRARVRGAGSRETLVGSGTDDGIDVLDRRVEFRIRPCGPDASASARDGPPA